MIVSNALFPEIFEIYLDYKNSTGPIDVEFAKKNRRKIKIIVDTLAEQSVENMLGEKPNNPLHGRQIINSKISSVSDTRDVEYLKALLLVLSHYDGITTKQYIDSTPAIDDLLKTSLSNLCSHLCSRHEYSGDQNARTLTNLLKSM